MALGEFAGHLAAAGVWAALLPTGALLVAQGGLDIATAHRTTRALVHLAAGSLAWSMVLLASAAANVFAPGLLGIVGWAVCALWLWQLRRARANTPPSPAARSAWWPAMLVGLMLAGAAALYTGWPKESLLAERDEAIYTLHAMHLLRTGENRIDLAPLGLAESAIAARMAGEKALELPGIYPTGTRWTFQFSALPSAWMAQSAATLGDAGLFRANALFSLLSALALFCLVRQWLAARAGPWPWVAMAAFLFNPAQVWVSRVNLSEPLAQWFTVSGLLLGLLAFRGRCGRTAALAGLVLGASALVRIDALLTVMLVLAAYPAAWATSGARRPAGPWWPMLAALALTAALAVAYYATDVAPYWNDHAMFVQPLLLGCAVLLAINAALATGRIPPPPQRAMRAAAGLACLALVAAFAYAALWRPHLPEPSLINSHLVPALNGQRDFRELSLANLAAYLGWPLLLAALAGYCLLIRDLARPGTALLLAVTLGCSLVFIWNPMISPDHVWASRRFVPVVFPGAIVMAAVALAALTAAWPGRLRGVAAALLGLALTGQLLHSQRETLTFAEDRGLLSALRGADDAWGTQARVYLVQGHSLAATLLAGFGRPALPWLDDDFAQASATHDDLAHLCSPGRPCTLLHAPGALFPGLLSQPQGELRLPRQRIESTPFALATGTTGGEVHRASTRVDGLGPPLPDRLVGDHRDWRIVEHGFWNDEVTAYGSVRWTNGDARIRLPALPARAVEVTLQLPAEATTRVQLQLNGTALFTGDLAGPRWQQTFALPDADADGIRTLRIKSDKFVASERYGGADGRTLGVKVESIRLLSPEPAREHEASSRLQASLVLVAARAPGLARSAIFSIRNDGDWTWRPPAETTAGQAPVQVGVLWLARGAALDGQRLLEQRLSLPRSMAPGDDMLFALALDPTGADGAKLPAADYDVVISPVLEGIAWFHDRGVAPLRIPVQASELE